jgi:hypothetical protein
MKRFLAVVSLILLISTFAAADGYVKMKNHTDPISIMGQNQPASDTVTEQWIGDGKMAAISPDSTTILDLEKNAIYMVNHASKTYVTATLPLDFSKLLPPEIAPMLQSMQIKLTVNPTGNKKTIGTRSCDEYDVDMNMAMMPMKIKMYATTDVPFDYKNYREKLYGNLVKTQMMGIDDASIEELKKINGFILAQEMTGDLMGAKINQSMEVTEIADKPAPAGTYTVPAGYTKQETLSMQDIQSRQGR